MKHESLLKIYVGNKLIGPDSPILVVVADNTWKETPFGEHYIFTGFPKLEFLYRRHVLGPKNACLEFFNFEAYPQIFSAQSLLSHQFLAARSHFEFSLSTLDRRAYMEIFWEGRTFEFNECDGSPLVQFKVYGKCAKEMATMFEFTRSKKLKELEETLAKLPNLRIKEEPSGGKT